MFGIDDLIGGALSVGGDLLGGWLNNEAAEDRQNSANAFSAQQYATRWQQTTSDMQKAGLNPMLAYSQGVGNPSGGVVASSPGYPSLGNSFNQGRMVDARNEQLTASASQARSQSNLMDETVNKVKQEVTNLSTDNERSKAVIDNLREQYQNLVKEGYNLTEQGNLMRSTMSKIRAEIPNLNEQNLLIRAQTGLAGAQGTLAGFDIKAAGDMGNAGRAVGQLKPFFDILVGILRSAR